MATVPITGTNKGIGSVGDSIDGGQAIQAGSRDLRRSENLRS